MARPVIASDEQILQAAHRVLDRRGPDAFSIAEVATEAGISRATIILRFRSTSALKLTLLSQVIKLFADAIAQVPKPKGGDGLLHIAAFIGSYLHSRESSAKFFSRYNASLQDPELTALEHKRGKILLDAISEVMPKVAIEHDAAVRAFLSQPHGQTSSPGSPWTIRIRGATWCCGLGTGCSWRAFALANDWSMSWRPLHPPRPLRKRKHRPVRRPRAMRRAPSVAQPKSHTECLPAGWA